MISWPLSRNFPGALSFKLNKTEVKKLKTYFFRYGRGHDPPITQYSHESKIIWQAIVVSGISPFSFVLIEAPSNKAVFELTGRNN